MRTLIVALSLVVVIAGLAPTAGAAEPLNIYTWDTYLPKDVLDDFTKRTGTPVKVSLYDSNEVMIAKLSSGVVSYDLVFPSEYAVKILADKKLIREIDKSKIGNWKNLDPELLDKPYDPQNKFCLPYFVGMTGIGYNKKILGNVDSWWVMFDPKHTGKIMMLNDMRECFGVALKLQGKGINEKDAEAIKQAGELLRKQKPLVRAYDSENFAEELRRGGVVLAHSFNGQVAKLMTEEPGKFDFVVPKEGGTIWIDNVSIPTSSRNVEAAYAFLNYVLEAETGARIVNFAAYASANKAAKEKIKPEILNNPAIYPTAEILKRCELIEHLGRIGALQAAQWRQIKAE